MGDLSVRGQEVPTLYACLYVAEFPAQARLRLRPKHRCLPVVVLDGEPPLQQVCSANQKAFALGVAQGMTSSELDVFEGLQLVRRSAEEERAARASLLGMAGVFTPRTEIRPLAKGSSAAFRFVLDMTGSARIFGGSAQIAESIRRAVRKLGFAARLALSANFHAAVCASAFAERSPVVIPSGGEQEALKNLPLGALELTPEQQEVFSLWGLHTCGELTELSDVDLVTRLGQEGRRLSLLARGIHPHLMVPEEPVFTLEERIAFDSPEERLDSLLFVIGPMLDQLIGRALAYALSLASVTVKLTLDGGGEHRRTVTPSLPVHERKALLKLVQLDLEAHPPAAGVLGIQLHATPGSRSKVQTGLFTPPLPEPTRLDVTLARIAALVGDDRVGRARLLDTHSSDSFVMEAFAVPAGASVPAGSSRSTVAKRWLRPPVMLDVRPKDRAPGAFVFGGRLYTVSEACGPWRRSGEWWSERVWSHEEWDVCAVCHEGDTLLCVLSQDLLRGRWQLEALYD